jgi:hypothetical protein
MMNFSEDILIDIQLFNLKSEEVKIHILFIT